MFRNSATERTGLPSLIGRWLCGGLVAVVISVAIPSHAQTLPGSLDGNFAILGNGTVTFSGDSTITGTATIGVGAVEYLVVGGGGGGTETTGYNGAGGGGGGAGGLVDGMLGLANSQAPITVTVGAGGAAGPTPSGPGSKGGDSVFGTITGLGGGGGGVNENPERNGGSGGGVFSTNNTVRSGGTATQPTYLASPGLGHAGGNAQGQASNAGSAGAGGGGAGGPGANAIFGVTGNNGGNGGDGVFRSITGTAVAYAGGGGGGARQTGTRGTGGLGGGGNGSNSSVSATAGAPNTGGGGGGGNDGNSRRAAAGGSGVVYVRYAGNGAVATGGTVTSIGGTPYTLHSYTATGAGTPFDVGGSFDASAQIATLTGNLSGAGGLTKTSLGTLVLAGANAYSGATVISAGTLRVSGSGSINSTSGITINGGQLDYNSSTPLTAGLAFTSGTLGGTEWTGSSLNNLTIGANMAISPGNSPGTANTVDQEWDNSGTYVWEINDATGTIGADPGWDLLSGTGNLTITATSGTPFTIQVTSLDLLNDPGAAVNFNQFSSYNWRIADFASEISTFSLSAFAVNTTNFQNAFSGNFSVARGDTVGGDNTQIYLTYVPVPEPATLALLAAVGGLAGIGYSRRRVRRA